MEMRQKMLEIACGEYGNIEVKGADDNPEVMKYYHETGRRWVDHDETPWCDAFLDWVIQQAGGTPTPGLNARAWLTKGKETTDPKPGDIAVFWRVSPDSVYGHVALFVRETDDVVWVLGGNQSDMVKISAYHKDRLLGYRRLT